MQPSKKLFNAQGALVVVDITLIIRDAVPDQKEMQDLRTKIYTERLANFSYWKTRQRGESYTQ